MDTSALVSAPDLSTQPAGPFQGVVAGSGNVAVNVEREKRRRRLLAIDKVIFYPCVPNEGKPKNCGHHDATKVGQHRFVKEHHDVVLLGLPVALALPRQPGGGVWRL